jgi:SAM-dependent methyltransferase
MWPIWSRLGDSVKSGKSAEQLAGGSDGFDRLTRDPRTAAAFNSAMVEITRLIADEVVRAYDFAGVQRIVDIGGGHGALLATILKTYPRMTGALLDLPHAIEGARIHLSNEGVAERCDVIAGDFFKDIPADAAVYLLKNILHDWSDDRSIAILRNCRRAISPDERLMIVEQMTPGRLEASPAHRSLAWTDLTMMVGPGGSQRTEAQFRDLLAASGFRIERTVDMALGYSIIESVPQ